MDRDIGECHVSSSTTRPLSATSPCAFHKHTVGSKDCLLQLAMLFPVRFLARRERAKPIPMDAIKAPAASMRLGRGRRPSSCSTSLDLATSARDVQTDLFSDFWVTLTAPEARFVEGRS